MSSFPRRNATRDARLKKKGNGFRKEAEARVVRTSRRRFFAFLSSPKARGFTRADDVRPLRGTASSHRGDGFGCPSCLRDGKRVARAGAARKSGERDVGGVGATFFFFFARPSRQIEERAKKGRAPCVRPHARAPMPKRRDTPAQKIVLEQVFFTNRSLEASWVNSVRSSQRRVVVSVAFRRARSRTKREIQVSRTSRHARARSIRRWGARRRRRVASPPSPPAARAPPPPPCGQK